MFGLIVSGRLVQTDFQQVGETQYVITIPDADNVNHVVVFLTGTVPFPDGLGGAVYFSWPDPNAPPNWQNLGFISNAKPSAIFKISNLKKNHEFENINQTMFGVEKISHDAQIGISVEPLSIIEQQSAAVAEETSNAMTSFSQKMLAHFFNYVSSFSVTQQQMLPNPSENFVPLSIMQNWYTTFLRRLEQNPNFWKA
ncbi:protein OPI10 homolog [Diprion similis]|uniref:protein OPI10 homolog n=1 Tax=Diprion similis TaxID=362088 RepID=UPI001EF89BC6|nr:protein OPI10 homolog [Diprion similis]